MIQKYPKFKKDKDCAYPKRDNCNWTDELGTTRCEYMKCISMGNWHCIFKKEEKQSNHDTNQPKQEESIKETSA